MRSYQQICPHRSGVGHHRRALDAALKPAGVVVGPGMENVLSSKQRAVILKHALVEVITGS